MSGPLEATSLNTTCGHQKCIQVIKLNPNFLRCNFMVCGVLWSYLPGVSISFGSIKESMLVPSQWEVWKVTDSLNAKTYNKLFFFISFEQSVHISTQILLMQLCFFQYLLFAEGKKGDNFASADRHSACSWSQQQVRILYEFKCPFSWWVFGFVTVLQEPLKRWPVCGSLYHWTLWVEKYIQRCISSFSFIITS